MKTPLPRELRELAEHHDGPALSIFLPTLRTGDTVEGPLRLVNLLRRAEKELTEAGMRTPTARQFLEPALSLRNDADFWKDQRDGLALFVGDGLFRAYRVPYSFPETVIISGQFHITPLVPYLGSNRPFYVLALSKKAVRLLLCTRDTASVVTPNGVPKNLDDYLAYDGPERQVNYHSSGAKTGKKGAAMYHGQAGGTDWEKGNLLRYARSIDGALHELFHNESAPLVIAAADYLQTIYREASTYKNVLGEGITGNPDGFADKELQERGLAVAWRHFHEEKQQALAMYIRRAGTGQATDELERVIVEANDGHVFKLFVTTVAQIWGSFDREKRSLEVHDRPQKGDVDLIDFATIRALAGGGSVYTLDPGDLPGRPEVAALLRYAEMPVSAE